MTTTSGGGVANRCPKLGLGSKRILRAALIATAVSIGTAAPTLAISPRVETVSIDGTFTPPALSAACGFDVTRHVEGTLTIRTFLDSGGDFRRELDAIRLTETLTANGRMLVGRTSQEIFVKLLPDGSYTVSFFGSDFRLPVPGSGISFGTVGRFVLLFSADNELIDIVQDVGDARADLSAICAALRPPG
jgi:hypothetical protein